MNASFTSRRSSYTKMPGSNQFMGSRSSQKFDGASWDVLIRRACHVTVHLHVRRMGRVGVVNSPPWTCFHRFLYSKRPAPPAGIDVRVTPSTMCNAAPAGKCTIYVPCMPQFIITSRSGVTCRSLRVTHMTPFPRVPSQLMSHFAMQQVTDADWARNFHE